MVPVRLVRGDTLPGGVDGKGAVGEADSRWMSFVSRDKPLSSRYAGSMTGGEGGISPRSGRRLIQAGRGSGPDERDELVDDRAPENISEDEGGLKPVVLMVSAFGLLLPDPEDNLRRTAPMTRSGLPMRCEMSWIGDAAPKGDPATACPDVAW